MLDIERELLSDAFVAFDMVYMKQMPMFAKIYADAKLPWLSSVGADSAKKKEKGVIGQMLNLYKKRERKKE